MKFNKLIYPLAMSIMSAALPLSAAASDQADEVRFIVPPWPGVTVKTEIVSQLLKPLGYASERLDMSSTVGYRALGTGDADAFLGGWLPAQQESYDAAMADNQIVDLGNNVDGARMGFAVPGYVYDAGVTSATQIDDPENRERFGANFYAIESGSTTSDFIRNAIANDTYGLGDWNLIESSTPGMLSAVDAAWNREEWVVFYGWTPHWMALKYDMHILADPEEVYGPNQGRSDVRTILARTFSDANPNLTHFLDQVTFSADEQSAFIRDYGLKEQAVEVVAHNWIEANPERVAEFLQGVETRDGQPGLPAVEEALQ
ncbi:ABC transporter substrate-binding protein [Kushneria aurantia]|uniref:ABC transporter substrate-binding protein n=1 Tax=Kushneria aurantia TaxID=504092 RepID=A0ABV6FZM2_9GAMM|nr:ABC transporter substrate-binding protein [Kushneria aurantia]